MRILYSDLFNGLTLTDSTEAAPYAGTNVQDTRLSRYWRSTSNAAQWLKGDAGAGDTVTADTMAIVGHNLTPGATVSFQGNATDAWGAPTVNVAGDASKPIIVATFPQNSLEFWRVYIDDPGNSAAYVQVSRVFLCKRWDATEPMDQSMFSQGYYDTSLSDESVTGQLYADIGIRGRMYTISMGQMLNATKLSLLSIVATAGITDPIIFDPVEIASDAIALDRLYCRFTEQPIFRAVGAWNWKDSGLKLKEVF